jgi:hypothetical protein
VRARAAAEAQVRQLNAQGRCGRTHPKKLVASLRCHLANKVATKEQAKGAKVFILAF